MHRTKTERDSPLRYEPTLRRLDARMELAKLSAHRFHQPPWLFINPLQLRDQGIVFAFSICIAGDGGRCDAERPDRRFNRSVIKDYAVGESYFMDFRLAISAGRECGDGAGYTGNGKMLSRGNIGAGDRVGSPRSRSG